ncbi:MAG: DUF456 domain-containing protein [Opitutales bacterium]
MSTLALSVVVLCFLLGLAGTVLPILPGTVIAFAGVLIHKLWMGADSVGWGFVAFCAVLGAASLVFDYVFTAWGARRYGASWKGALGAIVGGVVGIFIFTPLLGLILGPILGAVLFELMDGRTRRDAARAGFGTFIGGLAAFAVKLVCTLGIIGGFVFAV